MLKQNRGSAGEGIWVVKPHGWERVQGLQLTQDTLIQCTEMNDKTTHIFHLGDFMQMCLQYIEGESSLLCLAHAGHAPAGAVGLALLPASFLAWA